MQRILVVSDSHGKTEYIKQIINRIGSFDLIVHLGDYVRDIEKISAQYPEYEYRYVRGNCDVGSIAEVEQIFEFGGKKFFITHGHKYDVKMGYDRIIYRGRELGADCVLFGHTHRELCVYEDGMLILNPGAGKYECGSVGIVEIEGGKVKGCVIDV